MRQKIRKIKSIFLFILNIKNFRYYIGNILIVIIPTLFVIYPDLARFISYNWITITIFVLVMVLSVIFSLNTSYELVEKVGTIHELKHKNSNITSFLQTTPERVIKSIFNYLKFSYNERITVYTYSNSYFTSIGRYAKNPVYKKGGRKKYPYSEGFIGLAWQKGEFKIENLSDPIKKARGYINDVRGICNIEETTINDMNMKSRSYYCINLDNRNGDPIAVIVFESTDEVLPINIDEIKYLLKSSFGHLIVDMINMSNPNRRRTDRWSS